MSHISLHTRTLLPSGEPGCVEILRVVSPWHQVLPSILFFFIQNQSKGMFVGLRDFLSSYDISIVRFILVFLIYIIRLMLTATVSFTVDN